MPKATLEFTLPEETEEFFTVNHAQQILSTLYAVDQHLRTCLKHGHQYKDADEALEKVRDLLWDNARENDITTLL